MNRSNYQTICQLLAKQPPFTIEITPLEIFLVIEILLHGISKVVTVNRAVKDLVKKLVRILNHRYPKIANAIVVSWLSQLNI
ncbi:MAG: hypothetical protein AB4080_01970 [Trichodesmium sp.]